MTKKGDTTVADVTGKVYNRSKRMKEKRAKLRASQPSCAGSSERLSPMPWSIEGHGSSPD
ncbi:hypothetical protein [Bradyrhizobium sp. MOS002]|uniref:hypothetical protein n=1 Tax=Bradyrhizobium sp. MOS002 TaxID=2133947 RepID=UPI000D12735F|nr:hypothetical protein [Bradyrhizobium sp. MOS002]PSO33413.1 hypothetical protein C7G41_00030 [Bradyrhizobium sp. MOS002]